MDGRIILKLILKKLFDGVNGFIWLRTECSGGHVNIQVP